MVVTDVNKGRLLGAHCSIVGGMSNAAVQGGLLGCSAIQIFTKNANRWKASPLSAAEIDAFREAMKGNNIRLAVAHAAYLINLSTVDPVVHASSMESMRIELERAESLGLPYLIVHPGSHKDAGEAVGLMQFTENLQRLMSEFKNAKVQIVLETTAGQGASIGCKFEHFSEVLDRLDWPANIGLCVDTAHIFAAGYDISTKEGYEKVFREIDEVVGLDYIRVFHLNDSKTECGKRVDRHEHIGGGTIGENAFKMLMGDRRFAKVPMIIETPKAKGIKDDEDNLKLLRSFIK